jgi:hypothetical protein
VAEEPVSLRRVGVEEAVAAPRRRLIPAPSLLPSPPSPTGRPPVVAVETHRRPSVAGVAAAVSTFDASPSWPPVRSPPFPT